MQASLAIQPDRNWRFLGRAFEIGNVCLDRDPACVVLGVDLPTCKRDSLGHCDRLFVSLGFMVSCLHGGNFHISPEKHILDWAIQSKVAHELFTIQLIGPCHWFQSTSINYMVFSIDVYLPVDLTWQQRFCTPSHETYWDILHGFLWFFRARRYLMEIPGNPRHGDWTDDYYYYYTVLVIKPRCNPWFC